MDKYNLGVLDSNKCKLSKCIIFSICLVNTFRIFVIDLIHQELFRINEEQTQ